MLFEVLAPIVCELNITDQIVSIQKFLNDNMIGFILQEAQQKGKTLMFIYIYIYMSLIYPFLLNITCVLTRNQENVHWSLHC